MRFPAGRSSLERLPGRQPVPSRRTGDATPVKRWQETARVLERLEQLAEAGRPAALATVVEIEGSAYRRPGAKLLVEDDGTMTGSVSGGCLEQDVREVALEVMREGSPRLRHYETDDTALWGLGLGCGGKVDVFLQPVVSPDAAASVLRALLRGEETFAVSTVISESPPGGRALPPHRPFGRSMPLLRRNLLARREAVALFHGVLAVAPSRQRGGREVGRRGGPRLTRQPVPSARTEASPADPPSCPGSPAPPASCTARSARDRTSTGAPPW